MPYSINTVRFTEQFVVFDQIAIRISSIDTVEKLHVQHEWILKIRTKSGRRYEFIMQEPVDNIFDRLTS